MELYRESRGLRQGGKIHVYGGSRDNPGRNSVVTGRGLREVSIVGGEIEGSKGGSSSSEKGKKNSPEVGERGGKEKVLVREFKRSPGSTRAAPGVCVTR